MDEIEVDIVCAQDAASDQLRVETYAQTTTTTTTLMIPTEAKLPQRRVDRLQGAPVPMVGMVYLGRWNEPRASVSSAARAAKPNQTTH